jgi:diguanylate cyclase (GGDEF)-like protein
MEDLKAWYLGTLSVALSNFTAARRELAEGSPDVAPRIREAAHPLRGSGGTYGFPAISAAAAAVEEADDSELLASLDALLEALARVVAETKTGGGPVTSRPSRLTAAESRGAGSRAATTILVIEDDPSVSRLLQSELEKEGCEVLIAGTALDAREIINQHRLSLIVLDLVLPDSDGRTLLMSLRSSPTTASVPVIVLTVRGGVETEVECLTLGAHAFFEKPFDAAPFRAAVAEALKESPCGGDRALRDRLTGLPNRAALSQTFDENAPDREGGTKACLALIDFDRFRAVNDSCGDPTGDRVIAHIASTLRMATRAGDVLARWQGDRFAILLSGTDIETARKILAGAREMVRRSPFERELGGVINVTFSAGLAEVRVGESLERIVGRADRLLYLAKASGRNRVVAEGDEVSVPQRTVLLAEDDEATTRLIQKRLEREGIDVIHCANGEVALETAREAHVDLFLLDVRMPRMDGFELLERLRKEPRYAITPIVMLTSLGTEEYVSRGYDLGATDYIVKPADVDEVVARIEKHLGRWVTGRLDELEGSDLYAAALAALEHTFAAVAAGEALPTAVLEEVADRLIEALSSNGNDLLGQVAIPAAGDDDPLLRHSVNVAVLAARVGIEMGLAGDALRDLCLAGLLHDVGCLKLPDGLSAFAGSPSDDQQEEIRKRPDYAHEVIMGLGASYTRIAETVWQVYERLDGSGYPRGLQGEELSLEAQILGAVEAYEAWTHARSHRPDVMSAKQALEQLLKRAPEQFSRDVVKAMIECLGVFPVGTYVELLTGETGQVMETRRSNPLRPLIAVTRDPKGRPLAQPRIVDLLMSTQNAIKRPAPFPEE